MGTPHRVLTDGGSAFLGRFHAGLQYEYGIRHLVAPPFHPESNGINERAHQTLLTMIRAVSQEYAIPLPTAVQLATTAYNETPHGAIGVSPYEALFGRIPLYPHFQSTTVLPSESERRGYQTETIHNNLIRIAMERATVREKDGIKEGDLVVALEDGLRSAVDPMMFNSSTDNKWTKCKWTMPMKVLAIRGAKVEMQRYGFATGTVTRHKDSVRKYVMPDDNNFRELVKDYVEYKVEQAMEGFKGGSMRKRGRSRGNSAEGSGVILPPGLFSTAESNEGQSAS